MSSGLPVVRPGSFCTRPGAEGVTTNKTPMVCGFSGDGRLHWQGKDPTPPPAGRAVRVPTPAAAATGNQPLLFSPVVHLTPDATQAPLSADDRRLLEFEARSWASPGAKESEILSTFRMSSTRYYQWLNRLIDHPDANAAHPRMLGRLRRLRDRRVRR